MGPKLFPLQPPLPVMECVRAPPGWERGPSCIRKWGCGHGWGQDLGAKLGAGSGAGEELGTEQGWLALSPCPPVGLPWVLLCPPDIPLHPPRATRPTVWGLLNWGELSSLYR